MRSAARVQNPRADMIAHPALSNFISTLFYPSLLSTFQSETNRSPMLVVDSTSSSAGWGCVLTNRSPS